MRRFLIGLVLVAATATTATAERKTCCNLMIFEAAGGRSESYAVEVKGSGAATVAEVSLDRPPQVFSGAAARAKLRTWAAASRAPGADSVLVTGPAAHIHIDPLGARALEGDNDGDNLVIIQSMSAAKARDFVDQIGDLSPDMNAQMKAVIPAS